MWNWSAFISHVSCLISHISYLMPHASYDSVIWLSDCVTRPSPLSSLPWSDCKGSDLLRPIKVQDSRLKILMIIIFHQNCILRLKFEILIFYWKPRNCRRVCDASVNMHRRTIYDDYNYSPGDHTPYSLTCQQPRWEEINAWKVYEGAAAAAVPVISMRIIIMIVLFIIIVKVSKSCLCTRDFLADGHFKITQKEKRQ